MATWIETGVDGIFTLTIDDFVAVECDEVYAAKVKRVVCRTKAIIKELARVCVVQGDIVITWTGMKRHLELLDTIEIGLARVGVEAHVAHVPNECRFEGVDLGNGSAEFGGS